MMKKILSLLVLLSFSVILSAQITDKTLWDVYSTDSLYAWVVGAEGTILSTQDGGNSWMDYSIETSLSLFSIDFSDDYNGFIVGDSGLVLRTTDAGANWNEVTLPTDSILTKVEFVNSQYGWIFAGSSFYGGRMFRTIDGGNNWSYIDNKVRDYCMIDSLNGFGVALLPDVYRISKTTDGGLSWIQINNMGPIGQFVGAKICFADSLNGLLYYVAMGWPNLYKTIDGGTTWIDGSDDIAYAICFSTVNNVWIGDIYGIRYSGDFCQTFDYFDFDQNSVNSISAYGPDNGWAVGGDHNNNNGFIWKLTGINDWVEVLPISIGEGKSENCAILVYPNPTQSSITIELPSQPSKNTSLTISSTNGQQLITKPITELQTEIYISHLPVGIYIVKVWNNKEVMVQKVIKQ